MPAVQRQMDLWGRAARPNYTPVRSALEEDVPTSLELFAGGGGLALGLHRAGFAHAALVEFEAKACATLTRNAERWANGDSRDPAWSADRVHLEDVRAFLESERMPTYVDLLAGGPPCQPFSLGGMHAGTADQRNMFPSALEYVRDLLPKLVLFENVPGLTRPSFAPYFEYVEDQLRWPSCSPRTRETWQEHHSRVRQLASGGLRPSYWVRRQVINSADLGVPQTRRRVFLMAVRADLADTPPPPVTLTHSEDALLYAQWVEGTYWEERGLPQPMRPDALSDDRLLRLKLRGIPEAQPWRTVRDAIAGLPEPIDGVAAEGVLNHIGIPRARSYVGHTGSAIDWPSKTIKAGVHGVCGGEAMIRFPDGSLRYLTVREAARIQSFPDGYEFVGARSHAMRHIGNAVAVEVGAAVGLHLRSQVGL